MEGAEGGATPKRDAARVSSARVVLNAARRPDLGIRFGHDLNPLEGGGARRHRSYLLAIRAAIRYAALPQDSGVLNKSLGVTGHRAAAQSGSVG